MKKFLVLSAVLFQVFTSAKALESLKLQVVKGEFVAAAKKAYELGNGVSTNFSAYSAQYSELDNDSAEEFIYQALSEEYTGYSAPVRGIGVEPVVKNMVDLFDAVDFANRNLPKQNGAAEVLDSMKLTLVNIALKDGYKLGVYKVSSEGAWHACKELAWVDFETQEVLMTGSCWSE